MKKVLSLLLAVTMLMAVVSIAEAKPKKKLPKSHRHVVYSSPFKQARMNTKRHATQIPVPYTEYDFGGKSRKGVRKKANA